MATTGPANERWRWIVAGAVVVVFVATAAFTLVAPLRSFFHQRERAATVEREAERLESENSDLRDRIEDLGDSNTIERIAREELGLVRNGEEPYVFVDPGQLGGQSATIPQPPPTLPSYGR